MKGNFLKNIITLFFINSLISFSQEEGRYKLPSQLNEISGIEIINDTIFVAINDSGNEPILFLLNKEAKILKTVKINGAENNDWEDLAADEEHIYIGDFGNNLNKRKELIIYKVKIKEVLLKNEIESERIFFRYLEQKNFPPHKQNLNFDSEAFFYDKDSLTLFTKCNTYPWTGISFIYRIPKEPGTYFLKKRDELYVGPGGYFSDAITAADKQGEYIYLTTYNRILILKKEESRHNIYRTIDFNEMTQKESIVVLNTSHLFFADEKHLIFGGGFLTKYNISND
ncbi:MAG: hypothetical protein CL844_06965 [Crocinitomicaceae bacterium]|nr:hypothetical protein [Crocinitomicaceae bacterium]